MIVARRQITCHSTQPTLVASKDTDSRIKYEIRCQDPYSVPETLEIGCYRCRAARALTLRQATSLAEKRPLIENGTTFGR
ncbi:hypothetical protein MNBD_ACTINO02-2761 [hydrothermal vent metagenome]|uniref:Uncharacterized protein n=1 Tax=hydrothermal vent metagenome TaxID=652676 RepID=A0A3B0RTL6_9ZZZZ